MANPEITNNDLLKLPVFGPKFKDAVIKFTGAVTYAVGTIMARIGVAAGAVTADAGNTGDGTVTAFALAGGDLAIPGDYTLECITAVANGGEFKLVDPNGNLVYQPLVMTVGAGVATVFTVGGLTFTITDGAVDFIVGDNFALTVTDVGQKWTPYVAGAVDGSGIASGVLPAAVTSTGAGDLRRRMLVGGEVAKDVMLIHGGAVGTVPESVVLSLRNYGIVVTEGRRIDELDNQ
jgi:hypothetical protein